MEEIEFKNGCERLEHIVGADINLIIELLDILPFPYGKEIIELRFGIKDGNEHTLLEVANILQEREMKKSVIDRYISDTKHILMKPLFGQWTMEAVRKSEAAALHILKDIVEKC